MKSAIESLKDEKFDSKLCEVSIIKGSSQFDLIKDDVI